MTLMAGLVLLAQTAAMVQIDSAVAAGVRRGVFPGAVVVVGTADTVLLCKGYGHFTWSPGSPIPDPDSTLYDLASLTKVVATTPAIMRLVGEGDIDLDRSVRTYLPAFDGGGREDVTVRHLLQHRSGLRAFLPLNELTESADEARQRVLEEPPRWPPMSRVEYSDLNAMLLGWIVESVSGQPLDSFAVEQVFRPQRMNQTRFRPPRSERYRITPVGLWRGHAIAGEVHDQNAARLGGVSGHAGLYSTGADLSRYAQTLLRNGRAAGGRRVFSGKIVREFTRRGPGHRALGWEVNDTTSSDNTGEWLSADAFGHGGYTGTSIWIDPTNDLFIIILTNRVYAPKTRRSISQLKQVRGAVADGAIRFRKQICTATPASVSATPRLCR